MAQTNVKSMIRTKAAMYIAAGFGIVRLEGKAPWRHDWPVLRFKPEDFYEGDGIGINHAQSNTCAIDLDDLAVATEMLAKHNIHVDELLGAENAVQIISGRDNRAKLLYRVPEGFEPRTRKFTGPNGMALELRGGPGAQDVLPPSRHPGTGKAYTWGGTKDFRRLPSSQFFQPQRLP